VLGFKLVEIDRQLGSSHVRLNLLGTLQKEFKMAAANPLALAGFDQTPARILVDRFQHAIARLFALLPLADEEGFVHQLGYQLQDIISFGSRAYGFGCLQCAATGKDRQALQDQAFIFT
jgi:hypothetical protein